MTISQPLPRRSARSSLACSALALAATSMAFACGGGAAPRAQTQSAEARSAAPNTSAANPVVAYLRGAELQCETEEQEANIHRALEDLATLPVATLRARRYEDYAGTAETWDLPRVLRSHFVPQDAGDAGVVDEPDAFWAAVDSDEVRALAREMVRALDVPSRTSPVLAP